MIVKFPGRVLAAAIAVAAGLPALPGRASACLPPAADWRPPTVEEKAKAMFEWSSEIVYGVVTEDSNGLPLRFKVLHVYKGSLKPGPVLEIHGRDDRNSVSCPYSTPPQEWKGTAAVIGFSGPRAVYAPIYREELEIMFERGWIRSARSR